MAINLENQEIKNELVNFIKDESQSEITMNNYVVLKRKYKNNQLLYCKYIYKTQFTDLEGSFEYRGFYNLVTNQFYGVSYPFELSWDKRNPEATTLRNELENKIEAEIIKYLEDNHDTYFQDFSVKNKCDNEERFKSYARDLKNDIFYKGKLRSLNDFVCLDWKGKDKEEIKEIDFDGVLDYIETPEKCISKYKKEFLKKRKCDFYNQFERYQFYIKVYNDIQKDKSDVFHRQKAIKDALKEAKTANVTILKDGQKFTFKTETNVFLRLNNSYSSYEIVAKDRRKYKELFNYHDYTIDEILKIKYGKNEIYNKETYDRQLEQQKNENQ